MTVTLRPVEPGDAVHQQRWFADAEVTRWLALRYPLSVGAIESRLAQQTSDVRFTVLDDGTPVGYVALRGITPESRNAELDLVVGERSAQNRGVGTAATRLVCDHAFGTLGLHRVHLWVFAENVAAIRVYEKCGFVREAVARDKLYQHGRWHDCLLMGVLAEEWAA